LWIDRFPWTPLVVSSHPTASITPSPASAHPSSVSGGENAGALPVLVPPLGDVRDAQVLRWIRTVGDEVCSGDPLLVHIRQPVAAGTPIALVSPVPDGTR
jgi:hypothetical protein